MKLYSISSVAFSILTFVLPKKKLISNCETSLIERGLDATIAFLGFCLRLSF